MKPGASLMERFDGWFVQPIEKLKELPEGDGGFFGPVRRSLFMRKVLPGFDGYPLRKKR